jgi:hypothetical protein
MIAMTTSSSTNVKPEHLFFFITITPSNIK